MANNSNTTIVLATDDETKTTAYNMGCGLVAIEQYNPEAGTTNTVILTQENLIQLSTILNR